MTTARLLSICAVLVFALAMGATPADAQKKAGGACKAGTFAKCMEFCQKSGGGGASGRGGQGAACSKRCAKQGCV